MFLSKNLLPNALTVVGVLFLINEVQSAQLIKVAEARVNSATGQVGIAEQKRGGNPINMIGALGAIYLGVTNRGEDVEIADDDAPLPAVEVESVPAIATDYTPVTVIKKQSAKSKTFDVIQSVFYSYKPHALVTCETGTGKTFWLLGLMKFAYEQTNGLAEFYLSSVKSGNFLGLQDSTDINGTPRVVIVPKIGEDGKLEESANLIADQLKAVLENLDYRESLAKKLLEKGDKKPNFPPIYCILDEYPTLLSLLDEYNLKDIRKTISNRVATIARVGREFNGRVVILGQGYQVNTIGLNTDLKLNFVHLILGRYYFDDDAQTDIWACSIAKKAFGIEGQYPLFKKEQGIELWSEFKTMMERHKGSPVVWTDITGKSHLMPNLSGIDSQKLNWGQPIKMQKLTTDKDPWENTENAV